MLEDRDGHAGGYDDAPKIRQSFGSDRKKGHRSAKKLKEQLDVMEGGGGHTHRERSIK